jgi:hypothetical protein
MKKMDILCPVTQNLALFCAPERQNILKNLYNYILKGKQKLALILLIQNGICISNFNLTFNYLTGPALSQGLLYEGIINSFHS